MYIMVMLCQLCGEKDYSWVTEAWVPLAHTVVTTGKMFNQGDIITKKLSVIIQQAQNTKLGEVPSFYMVSYLLDTYVPKNIFVEMNLS